jgi:endonuclease IV
MDYIVEKMELNSIMKSLDKIAETAFKLDNNIDFTNEEQVEGILETLYKEQWKARMTIYKILESAYVPIGRNRRYLVKGTKKLIPIEFVENYKVFYKERKYKDALENLRTCFEILHEANPEKLTDDIVSEILSNIDNCINNKSDSSSVKEFGKMFSDWRKECGVLIITELNKKNKNK